MTPSLPFPAAGTSRWHSPHCDPIRRSCSGARMRSAGVGGAYGRVGQAWPPRPRPGSSPCRARSGGLGTERYRVCLWSGGCRVSPLPPVRSGIGRAARGCCCSLGPFLGRSFGFSFQRMHLCWGTPSPYLHQSRLEPPTELNGYSLVPVGVINQTKSFETLVPDCNTNRD